MTLFGCILKPFRKKSNEVTKSSSVSTLDGDDFTIVEHEQAVESVSSPSLRGLSRGRVGEWSYSSILGTRLLSQCDGFGRNMNW